MVFSHLSSSLHLSLPCINRLVLNPIRRISTSSLRFAPKKPSKGGRAEAATSTTQSADADHLFNIYKDYPDHEIGPDDDYPDWVNTIGKKRPQSYGALEMKFIYGKDIENAKMEEYRRFLKLYRRNQIRLNNMRLATHYRRVQYGYKNM